MLLGVSPAQASCLFIFVSLAGFVGRFVFSGLSELIGCGSRRARQAGPRVRICLPPAKGGIPLIIGSAGTSGSDAGLAWMVDIMHEIACEQELDRDEPLASRRAQSDPQVARIDLRHRLSLFAARDRPRPSL
jgi:hypothetical protein